MGFENGLPPERNVIFYFVLQSDGEDFNYIIAFFLGTAACLYQVTKFSPVFKKQFPIIVSRINSNNCLCTFK